MGGPTSRLVPGAAACTAPWISGAKGESAGMKGATFANIGAAFFTMRLNDLVIEEKNPISVYVARAFDSEKLDPIQLPFLWLEILKVPPPLAVEGPTFPRVRRRCPLQDV